MDICIFIYSLRLDLQRNKGYRWRLISCGILLGIVVWNPVVCACILVHIYIHIYSHTVWGGGFCLQSNSQQCLMESEDLGQIEIILL